MSADKDNRLEVPDNFEDAERFKRLFVDPAVQAMGQEIKAHLAPILSGQRKLFAQIDVQDEKNAAQDARLANLEGSNKKAMLGWGVYATVASLAIGAMWGKLREKLGW